MQHNMACQGHRELRGTEKQSCSPEIILIKLADYRIFTQDRESRRLMREGKTDADWHGSTNAKNRTSCSFPHPPPCHVQDESSFSGNEAEGLNRFTSS